MPRRTLIHSLLALSTAAALSAGGVLPAAAAAPPPPASAVAPAAPTPSTQWVRTEDAPSRISAELPGRAKPEETSVPVDEGEAVAARTYRVDLPGGGGAGFTVHDVPGWRNTLREFLDGFLESYNALSDEPLDAKDIKETTLEGRQVLDARLVSEVPGPDGIAGFIRLIAEGDHLVQIITFGPAADANPLGQTQARMAASLRFPTTPPPTSD
ncbi:MULTISPECIES: hypothetical protein [Streptomyces]|uniref:hypothetical protein n=1 Tax=Streptomyces TaxID=1883 RepID=UPI001677288A|nr:MULTISPECIES: hypothetical protein [Streptomyces]MBD3579509.1 hypothetical protein [Streptomyces sp. KD18]GGT23144.1 hypothetical protein GCM10010286_55770 [Streptomyces toxytricini]